MKLQRHEGNPILSPREDHPWEDLAVFNPAAWYDREKGEVLLLYRAAESGPEYKCSFGLAISRDSYRFERAFDEPAIGPSIEGFDGATIQDPRMVKMGDTFYNTYTCRLTRPEPDEVLMSFYSTVRPWGFWEPVYQMCRAQDPAFKKNEDFRRDMFNIAIGLVWQTSLVTSPIYLTIQHWREMWISLAVCAATSLVLKFTWHDRLPSR